MLILFNSTKKPMVTFTQYVVILHGRHLVTVGVFWNLILAATGGLFCLGHVSHRLHTITHIAVYKST